MKQREIKFRAWDKRFKEMRYDNEDLILLQFTGLKDKNGKEIYEGDIIEWDAFTGCKIKKRRRTEVGYYIREWASEFTFPTIVHKKSLEVIGNIYENKDLLK